MVLVVWRIKERRKWDGVMEERPKGFGELSSSGSFDSGLRSPLRMTAEKATAKADSFASLRNGEGERLRNYGMEIG